MNSASVGFQCPECVRAGQATIRRPKRSTSARVLVERFGLVTSALVVLNVLAFLATAIGAISIGRSPNDNYASPGFLDLSLVPGFVTTYHEYWRLLTSAFLHYGAIHVAVNMFALVILGRDLEQELGRVRYLAVYLVAALAGGVSVTLFGAVNVQTVGASGGIFGLLGALAVLLVQRKAPLRPLITLLVLNLAISFLPGISLLGHLGGAVGGALAMLVLVRAKGNPAVQATGLAVLVVALVVPVFV